MTDKAMVVHEQTAEGESTERWACRESGFFGSLRRLTSCARCGTDLPYGPGGKGKVCDLLNPTMHFLCDECFEQLPE